MLLFVNIGDVNVENGVIFEDMLEECFGRFVVFLVVDGGGSCKVFWLVVFFVVGVGLVWVCLFVGVLWCDVELYNRWWWSRF